MAKKSPAKVKKEAAEIKRAAALRRAQKAAALLPQAVSSSTDDDYYASKDEAWRDAGLTQLARRALVDQGFTALSDLRKVSVDELKSIEGIGENSIRLLIQEMKRADISFRS